MFSRRDFLQLIPNYSPMQTKSLIDFPPDRFIICTRPLHDDHFLSSPAFIYLPRWFCAKMRISHVIRENVFRTG